MQSSRTLIVLALASLTIVLACMIQTGHCQASGSFSGSRPASVIFEPTLAFIRQNMRMVNQYVALFRSIFVGAYDRPLITSTDGPPSAIRVPSPKVPPMDLPVDRSKPSSFSSPA